MAGDSSFDVVSDFDQQELVNALDQARREIATRYDFKDTDSSIEQKDHEITLRSSSEDRLNALRVVLEEKFVKRKVSLKSLSYEKVEAAAGSTVRQVAKLNAGISNAVIEHVGGRDRQRALVREALRVGRSVFVTTPNRWFPVELHTRLPLVHWLPDALSHRVYRALGMGFATENHLLSRRELAALFPGRVRVLNLGLTLAAIVD